MLARDIVMIVVVIVCLESGSLFKRKDMLKAVIKGSMVPAEIFLSNSSFFIKEKV